MYFYVPFHFFKVFFNFASVAKAAFCKSRAHRGTLKGGKMSLLFFLIKRHFFMHFYVPFHFFKVPFDFSAVAKPAFCKAKVHKGTLKGAKISFLFFFNPMAFCHVFLGAISFFQSLFQFCFRCKSSILEVLSTWGYLKRSKLSFLFFCNQTALFHAFLRAISFFQSLFRFFLPSKSSILQV